MEVEKAIKRRVQHIGISSRVGMCNYISTICNEHITFPMAVSVITSLVMCLLIHGLPEVKDDFIVLATEFIGCLVTVYSATMIASFIIFYCRVMRELDTIICGENLWNIIKHSSITITGVLLAFSIVGISSKYVIEAVGIISIILMFYIKHMILKASRNI